VAIGSIDLLGKCIRLHALIVVKKPKCHLNQQKEDLYIAGSVLGNINQEGTEQKKLEYSYGFSKNTIFIFRGKISIPLFFLYMVKKYVYDKYLKKF
jgi:hypothetical protein